MVLAWAIATLAVGAFATALGMIILRMRGHYFAIASIGVVEVVRLVISSAGGLTGGGDGLNLPLLGGGPDAVARIFLAVMISMMLIVFVVTVIVDRSRLGYGLRCIQQNEDAAEMVGVDTNRYKVVAYALSALFCGTVGCARTRTFFSFLARKGRSSTRPPTRRISRSRKWGSTPPARPAGILRHASSSPRRSAPRRARSCRRRA